MRNERVGRGTLEELGAVVLQGSERPAGDQEAASRRAGAPLRLWLKVVACLAAATAGAGYVAWGIVDLSTLIGNPPEAVTMRSAAAAFLMGGFIWALGPLAVYSLDRRRGWLKLAVALFAIGAFLALGFYATSLMDAYQ